MPILLGGVLSVFSHLEFNCNLTLNICVNTRLFTRKEEEAKLTVANNGWCHIATVTNFLRALTLAGIAILSALAMLKKVHLAEA